MVKIASSYSLCPLIEQKNFLGVSEDSQSGHVIVSLGRNIVIRYRLCDQKQVNSWSSKEKLSAPGVYDCFKDQYIGVFGGNSIGFWKDSFVDLNNIKKYSFTQDVHSVLTAPAVEPIIVYRNGRVSSLYTDLEERKASEEGESFLPNSRRLSEAKLNRIDGTQYVSLVSVLNDETFLTLVPIDLGRGDPYEIRLVREGTTLLGHCIIDEDEAQLITLWSDGKVFSLEMSLGPGSGFPGRFVTTITDINLSLPSAFVPISSEHVAIYAPELKSEGAILIIMNTRFGVVLSSSQIKMYSNPPRLWRVGSSQLILVIGQYLAVVPFELDRQRLASLVGTHQIEEHHTPNLASWEPTAEFNFDFTRSRQINLLLARGMSHAAVSQQLIPPLLENKNIPKLRDFITDLKDIPDSFVVQAVVLCLGDVTKYRNELLDILKVPLVNDSATMSLVCNGITLEETLALLRFLEQEMSQRPGDKQLVDWVTLLLDSHYQQFILSKDPSVISTLSGLRKLVQNHLEVMDDMQCLDSYIQHIKRGQGFSKRKPLQNKKYSVGQIILY